MPEKDKLVPVVPAQEAPRELTLDELCLCEEKTHDGFHDDKCPVLVPAEPQAGAQVPFEPREKRLEKALQEAKEFIENLQLDCEEWSRVLDLCVAALERKAPNE
jgi:hypothetical protein